MAAGAVNAAVNGGNFGQSIGMGALFGGIMGGIGGDLFKAVGGDPNLRFSMSNFLPAVKVGIIAGAAFGGLSTAFNPKSNFFQNVLFGAIGGGIGSAIGFGAGAAKAEWWDSMPGQQQGQSKLPARASAESRPDLEDLANDPKIAREIEAGWNRSLQSRSEEAGGFWIVRSAQTGTLDIVPYPECPNCRPWETNPGIPPPNALATFHPHPFVEGDYGLSGWEPGPSPRDLNYTRSTVTPGIIRSHEGMHYYRPKVFDPK
jgi:hypothetical protein